MAYIFKFPTEVTNILYSMRDFRYENVKENSGTPSAQCISTANHKRKRSIIYEIEDVDRQQDLLHKILAGFSPFESERGVRHVYPKNFMCERADAQFWPYFTTQAWDDWLTLYIMDERREVTISTMPDNFWLMFLHFHWDEGAFKDHGLLELLP